MAELLSNQTRGALFPTLDRWLAVRVGATAIAGTAVGSLFRFGGGHIGFIEGTVIIALILWLCYWPQLVGTLPGGASWWNRILTLTSCIGMGYAFSTLLKFRYQSSVLLSSITAYQIVVPIAVGFFVWIFWWVIIESRRFLFCMKLSIIPIIGILCFDIYGIISDRNSFERDIFAALFILVCAALTITVAMRQSTAQNKARTIIFDVIMLFIAEYTLCIIIMTNPGNNVSLKTASIQAFLILVASGSIISNLIIIAVFIFNFIRKIILRRNIEASINKNQPRDVIFSLSTSILINMTIIGIPLCLFPYLRYMKRSLRKGLKAPRRLAFMAAGIYATMYIYYDFIALPFYYFIEHFGIPINLPSALVWGGCSAVAAWVIGSNLKDFRYDFD